MLLYKNIPWYKAKKKRWRYVYPTVALWSGFKEQSFHHKYSGFWSAYFYHFYFGANSYYWVQALWVSCHPLHCVRKNFLYSMISDGIRIHSGLRSTWKIRSHYFNAYFSLAICPVFLLQKYPLQSNSQLQDNTGYIRQGPVFALRACSGFVNLQERCLQSKNKKVVVAV